MKPLLHKAALAILIAGAFFSCSNDIEKVKEFTIHEKLPIESTTNVELLYSDSAVLKIKLTAPKLERYMGEKPYVEFPEGLNLIMYNDAGEADSQIRANYAINFEQDKRMEAMNDVVVINKYGEKLNTEHLIWDAGTKKIHTDEFVKITTKEEILYGDGMVANEDFTKFQILNIKGTINIEDGFEEE